MKPEKLPENKTELFGFDVSFVDFVETVLSFLSPV